MKRIGLTGGIGSGKTTVAKLIQVLGYPVYSSDDRGRVLTQTDTKIVSQLREKFGDEIFDTTGKPDRKKLADLVFVDSEKLKQLNAIIHPAVAADFEAWCNKQSSNVIFKEAAIIFEHNLEQYLDAVWVVHAPETLRIRRVMMRNAISEADVRMRMSKQLDSEELLSRADLVIVNDEVEMLIPQVLKAVSAFG